MQLLATDNRDDFVVYDSPLPDDYEDEDLPMDLEGVEGAYVDDLIWGKEAGCYVTIYI